MKSFFRKLLPSANNIVKDSLNLIFEDKKQNISKEEITGSALGVKKIYKLSNDPIRVDDSDFNYNIDNIIDKIVRAKEVDGYIARVLANFREKAIKTGFYFESEKKENINKLKNHLENILINSGSSLESFIQECFNNYSSFGNLWIHKAIDPVNEKIYQLTVMPSKGWRPDKCYGTKVIQWKFEVCEIEKTYTLKNVFHLYYEKETHHVFGVPVIYTALDDAGLLRELENSNYQDYLNSLEKKTIFYVGDNNNRAKQVELDSLVSYLNSFSPNDDLVFGGHIRAETMSQEYNQSGLEVVNAAKQRVLSSLRSSGTSVGEMGAGRQDADTLGGQDDVVVEDLQSSLENQLNLTIIRQLCFDLFGEVTAENQVKLRFNPTFTTQERKEKHDIFKFLSNGITVQELRNKLGEDENVDEKKLYGNLFAKEGMTQQGASNKTNPSNQHGSKGNSKPSVKN